MSSPSPSAAIHHVSDTAVWVAHYRVLESQRADALFRDPLAKVLTGERGRKIAEHLEQFQSQTMTQWSVVIRTVVIDELIQKLVSEGVDMVVNLGAGLDTRPYRLTLPESLQWVEVDYPDFIAHKESLLAGERPNVRLERAGLDLADDGARRSLLARLGARAKCALILTEGVVPYLTEEQVAALSDDLHAQPVFRYWIAEYFAPETYRWFKAKKRRDHFKNAPFQFFPADWLGLFRAHGWTAKETRYLAEEGQRLGRPIRLPWWVRLLLKLGGQKRAKRGARFVGYILFQRNG
ncbi:MAG TPA: SAM-dependent methyltransferase [Verrucomicrobiales bacterium]|nr:SAM-dependent methyltransferase [Verrucomicrobiales bacterium]